MMRVTFCGECGVRANPHKDRCHLCGGRLPHSKEIIKNPGVYAKMAQERPKAVIFDLDMTIFNNSQRFTDARRAGLVDKDGKAVAKGMMSTGQAWRKRNKFIYSDKALAKDTVIPGAKELISDLSNDGYVLVISVIVLAKSGVIALSNAAISCKFCDVLAANPSLACEGR